MSRNGGIPGAAEDLPHAVNVLGPHDALLDNHEALALDRGPNAVEDEAVALAPNVEGHEPVLRQLAHQRSDNRLVGSPVRHQLDRRQLGRLLVVRVQDPFWMLHVVDELAARKRRGVAGEDGVGIGEPVELAEDLSLQLQFLGVLPR
jgi:hypothetical protein